MIICEYSENLLIYIQDSNESDIPMRLNLIRKLLI